MLDYNEKDGIAMKELDFYRGKKVLITGHTGFKGSWMCQLLLLLGADVTGYALEAPTTPGLFDLCHLENKMKSFLGDIRDLEQMKRVFEMTQPEIVIHMAAQPLVRESYKNPVYTYETNVMGTVHVLECVRAMESVRSVINVTTDKVYRNREWEWGYRENEELNGYDPYSNSKSCSELVTSSYIKSFLEDRSVAVSTARAGNVIGGGDFAEDRIIPDCVRAAWKKEDIIVRNPYSIRPYEHVLEPVAAYLLIAARQYEKKEYMGSYNVGPDDCDCQTTGNLVSLFCKKWNAVSGDAIKWTDQSDGGPHEANFLKLDCSKLKQTFGWRPRWNVETAMEKVVEWSWVYFNGGDMEACMRKQIQEFILSES